jgi:transcriptional regulator with XRE-family HTH domain
MYFVSQSTSTRAQLRRKAAYTLRQLEHDSGVSRSCLSAWERGELSLPTEKVLRISFALYYSLRATPTFVSVQSLADFLTKEGT